MKNSPNPKGFINGAIETFRVFGDECFAPPRTRFQLECHYSTFSRRKYVLPHPSLLEKKPLRAPKGEGTDSPPSGGCEAVSLPDVRRTEGELGTKTWLPSPISLGTATKPKTRRNRKCPHPKGEIK